MAGPGRMRARVLASGRVLAGELRKADTLPSVRWAILGTALVSGVLGGALAGASSSRVLSTAGIALQLVPYLQAGVVLLGVVVMVHEYAGRQISTTLLATPRRAAMLAAKSAAVGVGALLTAVAGLGASLGGAALVRTLGARWDRDEGSGAVAAHAVVGISGDDWRRLVGAIVALVLLAVLAYSFSLLLPRLMPALVVVLCLVFLVPVVVAGLGWTTSWLPSSAVSELTASAEGLVSHGELTEAGAGILVMLGWILCLGGAGALRFFRADA